MAAGPQGESGLSVEQVLESYGRYVSGLDDFCMKLRTKYWGAMECRPGCVSCCSTELTVFPLEAAWIRRHVEALGGARKRQIRTRLEAYRASGETTPCPFLHLGRCLAYAARPLLCRTEGFALAHRGADGADWHVTTCPRNFKKMDLAREVPGSDLINLESLNQSLAVLNHAYVKTSGWEGKERERLSAVLSPRPQG